MTGYGLSIGVVVVGRLSSGKLTCLKKETCFSITSIEKSLRFFLWHFRIFRFSNIAWRMQFQISILFSHARI